MVEITKKKINIGIGISDIHFGHENCLYETYEKCIDDLIANIEELKEKNEIKNIIIILNGDIVSVTFVYRNQYLESQVQKNETILLGGAYLIHKTLKRLS